MCDETVDPTTNCTYRGMEMNRDASYISAVGCNFNGVEMEDCEPLRVRTTVGQLTVIPGSYLWAG